MLRNLPRLNVVLCQPTIPFNVGNAGRTCLGFGAALLAMGGRVIQTPLSIFH
jgi:tRNA(Leu) C34 or U34 (ribose-2'-O)-methylase TrmL